MNAFKIIRVIVLVVAALARDIEWKDSEITQRVWTAIKNHDSNMLIDILSDQSIVPPASMRRSSDGKGVIFSLFLPCNLSLGLTLLFC
jgi:hypothetical protein